MIIYWVYFSVVQFCGNKNKNNLQYMATFCTQKTIKFIILTVIRRKIINFDMIWLEYDQNIGGNFIVIQWDATVDRLKIRYFYLS